MTEFKESMAQNLKWDKLYMRICLLVGLLSSFYVLLTFILKDRWSSTGLFILIIAIVFSLILGGSINVANDAGRKRHKQYDD